MQGGCLGFGGFFRKSFCSKELVMVGIVKLGFGGGFLILVFCGRGGLLLSGVLVMMSAVSRLAGGWFVG